MSGIILHYHNKNQAYNYKLHLDDFALYSHEKGYTLSSTDLCCLLFSGASYANRHLNLAKKYDWDDLAFWFHMGMGILEHIPLVGSLLALAEKAVIYACSLLHIKFQSSKIGSCERWIRLSTFAKKEIGDPRSLWKNLQKAIKEHNENEYSDFKEKIFARREKLVEMKDRLLKDLTYSEESEKAAIHAQIDSIKESVERFDNEVPKLMARFSPSYISVDQVSEPSLKKLPTLAFEISSAEAQGRRPSMEDATLIMQREEGTLLAIFDGHNGAHVSRYASEQFEKRFFSKLDKDNSNVIFAMTSLINEIHEEINEKSKIHGEEHLFERGSTAAICFICPITNIIYTGTVGDTEAKIYVETEKGIKSIPLSPIRNWITDIGRVIDALGDAYVDKRYFAQKQLKSSKKISVEGLNVSRAIGDGDLEKRNGEPLVIHKAKYTAYQLDPSEKDQTIILGCDGLWDYVQESKVAQIVEMSPIQDLAQNLVEQAIDVDESGDNVSVIAVKVSVQK